MLLDSKIDKEPTLNPGCIKLYVFRRKVTVIAENRILIVTPKPYFDGDPKPFFGLVFGLV